MQIFSSYWANPDDPCEYLLTGQWGTGPVAVSLHSFAAAAAREPAMWLLAALVIVFTRRYA